MIKYHVAVQDNVYSYKWYSENCHYDSEIGDGSIVYSLTGLIPEKITI